MNFTDDLVMYDNEGEAVGTIEDATIVIPRTLEGFIIFVYKCYLKNYVIDCETIGQNFLLDAADLWDNIYCKGFFLYSEIGDFFTYIPQNYYTIIEKAIKEA